MICGIARRAQARLTSERQRLLEIYGSARAALAEAQQQLEELHVARPALLSLVETSRAQLAILQNSDSPSREQQLLRGILDVATQVHSGKTSRLAVTSGTDNSHYRSSLHPSELAEVLILAGS